MGILNAFALGGISIIGTKIMCHRYLLQKAETMNEM
jgi:hypothetical protein